MIVYGRVLKKGIHRNRNDYTYGVLRVQTTSGAVVRCGYVFSSFIQ